MAPSPRESRLVITREIPTDGTAPATVEKRARHAEALFDAIDDSVFVHDLSGSILDANPAACRRLGYTREELLHLTTRDIDDPDFARDFEDRLREQLAQGGLRCEGRHRAKDGTIIPVDINSSVVEIDGQTVVLAVMRDITRRKNSERRQATLYAVTQVVAESQSLAAAGPAILQALAENIGWDLGVFWLVAPEAAVLRCLDVWCKPTVIFPEF